MAISDILYLIGGLALFLFGMKMMSDGLEAAAGNKLKSILERLTSNRFLGVLVGLVITAAIQSSSGTTVMVVGFVNSGMMKLTQAVGVIMGANIGTTVTGQLIALDIGALAPIIAFVGVIMISFMKGQKVTSIGQIIAGLGILFIGMSMMSTAMVPLRDNAKFIEMMVSFKNPLYGIMAGALFTALIQSSSASVGILQALAVGGVIGLDSAVYVLFGQNIGTCITAVLASLGANRNAKRATVVHLSFNILGTIIFVMLAYFLPLTDWVASWTPSRPAAQIANMHTLFNITTTLLLFPFGNYLAKLSYLILPEKAGEEGRKLLYLQRFQIGHTAIAISQLLDEVANMFNLAKDNISMALDMIITRKETNLQAIREQEEYIDYLNMEITRYISEISGTDMPRQDAETINALFRITGNIERIGDHAINITEHYQMMISHGAEFSKHAIGELVEMQSQLQCMMSQVNLLDLDEGDEVLKQVLIAEDKIDDMNSVYRQNQLARIAKGRCTPEACVIYNEILTDLERVADHFMVIARECHDNSFAIPKESDNILIQEEK